MSEPHTVMMAYWTEHRQQLRQSENQRATLTNYLLIITAALSGFIAQQKFAPSTLPSSALILVIGTYGAITTAKYHERAEYHLMQARALTKTLEEAGLLASSDALIQQYRDGHYQKYPRLHKIRLHHLWTGLHVGIAMYGILLAATSIAKWAA